ncbi:MAG: hypothetical protein LR015_01325 [Verrucomicrobia bacterium]|nr:hypothetical protein [Verrucomicrobiota bacterium]
MGGEVDLDGEGAFFAEGDGVLKGWDEGFELSADAEDVGFFAEAVGSLCDDADAGTWLWNGGGGSAQVADNKIGLERTDLSDGSALDEKLTGD